MNFHVTDTELGQAILMFGILFGAWFQNSQSNKRAKQARQEAIDRQALVESQIKLAAAELALTAAKAHHETAERIAAVGTDAKLAFQEANTVNQKIALVGAGTLKLAEAMQDATDAKQLSSDLTDAKASTDKANGHSHEEKPEA